MASKGQKYKQWTAKEKYEMIKPIIEFEIVEILSKEYSIKSLCEVMNL